jgi:5-methylcytosine-specific restriction protein A
MKLERELHDQMLALYRIAGEATGYCGRRYKRSVENNGGLRTAKRMLKPRRLPHAGLEALLEANQPKLTLEYLVLLPRFASLFTAAELAEARRRLAGYIKEAKKRTRSRLRLFPDELPPGTTYPEGARKTVRVNAYERNAGARTACLAHHGKRCAVCDMSFHERYAGLGQDFIHVHHTRPMAGVTEEYRVDPIKDLVPVCPNCHAMLHFAAEKVLTVEQLRQHLGLGDRLRP